MNPFKLWCECWRFSIRLTAHSDRLRYKGPKDAVRTVLPLLAENKAAMVACVADLSRYLMTDGPLMPWYVPMSPDRTTALLDDLKVTVGKVADIEGWSADYLTRLLGLVARQSISTLVDDLAYFRERSNAAVMLSKVPSPRLTQQGEYENRSTLSPARPLSRQGAYRGAIESGELDHLRQSFRSTLDKRALPLEGLKGLAATLFLTCFATTARCEETLTNRQTPTAELELHAQELPWSIEVGNALAFVDFPVVLPVRFEQARQTGVVAVKSDSDKNAATAKQKKLQPMKEYALKLVNEGNYRSRRNVATGIKDRVSELQLTTIGRALALDQAQRTIEGWLKEFGYVPNTGRKEESGPKLE